MMCSLYFGNDRVCKHFHHNYLNLNKDILFANTQCCEQKILTLIVITLTKFEVS